MLKLWCWRRLLRVPWTARRSNQSILKEINSEHSLEGRMLKLQYFEHLMRRANSFEKTLMLGEIEGRRRRGQLRMRRSDGWLASPTRWTWVWQAPGDGEGQGGLVCCRPRDHRATTTTTRPPILEFCFPTSYKAKSSAKCKDMVARIKISLDK